MHWKCTVQACNTATFGYLEAAISTWMPWLPLFMLMMWPDDLGRPIQVCPFFCWCSRVHRWGFCTCCFVAESPERWLRCWWLHWRVYCTALCTIIFMMNSLLLTGAQADLNVTCCLQCSATQSSLMFLPLISSIAMKATTSPGQPTGQPRPKGFWQCQDRLPNHLFPYIYGTRPRCAHHTLRWCMFTKTWTWYIAFTAVWLFGRFCTLLNFPGDAHVTGTTLAFGGHLAAACLSITWPWQTRTLLACLKMLSRNNEMNDTLQGRSCKWVVQRTTKNRRPLCDSLEERAFSWAEQVIFYQANTDYHDWNGKCFILLSSVWEHVQLCVIVLTLVAHFSDLILYKFVTHCLWQVYLCIKLFS